MSIILVITVLFMLTSIGFGQHVITMQIQELKIPPCKNGLRSGKDKMVIIGSIGPNLAEAGNINWDEPIVIQVLKLGANQFSEMCSILLGNDGEDCEASSVKECYCNKYNTATSTVQYVLNKTANFIYTLATIRGEWAGSKALDFHTSNNITLPKIHGTVAATGELKLNGKPVIQKNGFCGSTFTPCSVNIIEFCCNHSASPCNPRIDFDGVTVTNKNSSCVKHAFNIQNNTFKVNVTTWYSMCTFSDYKPLDTCEIKTKVNTADLEMKLNGQTIKEENGFCGGTFTFCSHNTVELCCTSETNPCYPKIGFDDIIVAEKASSCVKHTFEIQNDTYTVKVAKLYSLCTDDDYITSSICEINTEVKTAGLSMNVNNQPTIEKNGFCETSVMVHDMNTIELCCTNMTVACYPRIAFNGRPVPAMGSPCVKYAFKPDLTYKTVNVTQSYSLCSSNKYITTSSCLIKLVLRSSVLLELSWEPLVFIVLTINLVVLSIYIWRVNLKPGKVTEVEETPQMIQSSQSLDTSQVAQNSKSIGIQVFYERQSSFSLLKLDTEEWIESDPEIKEFFMQKKRLSKAVQQEHWSIKSEHSV